MNKKVSTKIFSAIVVTALTVSANVSGYMGGFDDDRAHVNLNVGSTMINSKVEGTTAKVPEDYIQFGLDFDYKLDMLPFNIAAGYFTGSDKKDSTVQGTEFSSKLGISEIRLGARKYQAFSIYSGFSIYYGAGLSSVSVETTSNISANKYSKAASSLGIYGELGGLYKITDAIYVGANVTHTNVSVKIKQTISNAEVKTTANGATQIGLVVGYAF